ncbi:MAG: aquaporin [Candidatus Eremiobacteraeota bacterium]|nr:aquaporin [Candidatus Eremiobacteraeota bacterium]
MTIGRRVAAEFVGTAFLVLAVVGSGIAAERLCGANAGLALLANAVATGGALVALILAFGYAVSAYIVGAYRFTPSTSFANPAVTIARALTDTFAGIRPSDVPLFIFARLLGGGMATVFFAYLQPQPEVVRART